MSKRIKRMARRALLEKKGYYYQHWLERVLDAIDERRIKSEAGILIERPIRPVGASQLKLQMQILKACHSATSTGHCLLPSKVFISHSHATEMLAANAVVCRGVDISTADVRIMSSFLRAKTFLVYNAPRFRSGGVKALCKAIINEEVDLRVLSLSSCNLDTRAARCLSRALRSTTCGLKELKLEDDRRIGDKGCALLAFALQSNDRLTHLCLTNIGLTDKGVLELTDALRRNSNLVTLDVSGNHIGEKGVHAMADTLVSGNKSIKILRIGGQLIQEEKRKLENTKFTSDTKLLTYGTGREFGIGLAGLGTRDSLIYTMEQEWTREN